MTLFQKISTLFKLNKPATELVGELKVVKSGYKTVSFWVTLLGTLLTLAAAVKAIIPATAALIIITALTALYNILRGLTKSETGTQKGALISTEFWIGVLGEITKALVALQTGGVNPAWFAPLSTIVAAAMAAAQSMGNHVPKADE